MPWRDRWQNCSSEGAQYPHFGAENRGRIWQKPTAHVTLAVSHPKGTFLKYKYSVAKSGKEDEDIRLPGQQGRMATGLRETSPPLIAKASDIQEEERPAQI